MLEDRYYMRPSRYQKAWSATIILMIVNAVCFLLQKVDQHYVHATIKGVPLISSYSFLPGGAAPLLPLSPQGLGEGYVWQLVTFQFLHANTLHLIMNLLTLYMLGRFVEESLGPKSFLRLYFLSGVFGGLAQVSLGWLLPRFFGGPTVGASAGIFGVVAAFAALHPEQTITIFAYFIPVTMKAKYLLVAEAVLAVFGVVFPEGQVAHAAHLGGMIGGLVYAHLLVPGYRRLFTWPTFRRVRRRELVGAGGGKRSFWPRAKSPTEEEDLPPAEFISKEVDPILDKISAHGIHSLTPRERQILEEARAKMRKR